ncbi:MAG: glycosyltransferase [Gemmiger sp.]|nr:glycosyltransferase [Gemmiger sp.]
MKILMIGNNLGIQSGVQRYIQNLLVRLDYTRFAVDLFISPAPPDQASTQPELEALGVHMVLVPDNDKPRFPYLYRHLKAEGKGYDIIHFHTASKVNALACVMIKALCPHAKLIVHSHIVYPPVTLTWHLAHRLYQATADYFLGCGVAAGRFVFGSKIDQKQNFAVACNAVDKARFAPDAAARARLRGQYHLAESDRLAGFVGRYNHQKNLLYLLDVFAAMAKSDPRWRLMLVGGGEDQAKVDAKIAALGLGEKIIQAGVQSDVPAYMNAFDLFLLPSNFEGSPVTLVEAQGCGVPCLASENVPNDGSVTPLVRFLPLDAPFEAWAALADTLAVGGPHSDYWPVLEQAGYELATSARRMEALYEELAGGAAR